MYRQALDVRRRRGDKKGIAASLNNLGNATLGPGDRSAARSLYQESLALATDLGNMELVAVGLAGLGEVAIAAGEAGEIRKGVTLLGAADAAREATGVPMDPADRICCEQAMAIARARLDETGLLDARRQGERTTMIGAVTLALERPTGQDTPALA